MQSMRSIAALAVIATLLSACGGNAGATQQPAGATTNPGGGGSATQQPAATDEPAATTEMGGPVSKTVDLGFVPAGSLFGGAQGSSLSFTNEGSNQVVSILVGPDNKIVISYGGPEFSMPGTECTTSNWNIGATSG